MTPQKLFFVEIETQTGTSNGIRWGDSRHAVIDTIWAELAQSRVDIVGTFVMVAEAGETIFHPKPCGAEIRGLPRVIE